MSIGPVYLIYMVGLFSMVPVALLLSKRVRISRGLVYGAIIFAVTEALWWSAVSHLWVFDQDISGTFRFAGLYAGDWLMVVGVYISSIIGIAWLAPDWDSAGRRNRGRSED